MLETSSSCNCFPGWCLCVYKSNNSNIYSLNQELEYQPQNQQEDQPQYYYQQDEQTTYVQLEQQQDEQIDSSNETDLISPFDELPFHPDNDVLEYYNDDNWWDMRFNEAIKIAITDVAALAVMTNTPIQLKTTPIILKEEEEESDDDGIDFFSLFE